MNSVTNHYDKKKRKVTSLGASNDNNGDFVNCCPCMQAADYLDTLPLGYRFKPTDEELITGYLLPKINNLVVPKSKIFDVMVYEHHPKDLAESYPAAKEGEWYFFTSRNRKYPRGTRPCRKAGPGYWKATGPDHIIKHDNGKKMGQKKSLVYNEGKSPNGVQTDWAMHEYVVEGHTRKRMGVQDMKLDDYVLCRIYNNKKYKKKQNAVNQQPNVSTNDPGNESVSQQPNVAMNDPAHGSVNQQTENGSVNQQPNVTMNDPSNGSVNQQPNVAMNDPANGLVNQQPNVVVIDPANGSTEVNSVQHAPVVLDQVVQLSNILSNICHDENNLPNLDSYEHQNASLNYQQARFVPNQNVNRPTNFQFERNPVFQLSNLLSNIRCVNNLSPAHVAHRLDQNQQFNPRLLNGVQVKNNMMIQNSLQYHDQNLGYVPRTSNPNMVTPSVNHSSQNQFMNTHLLANRSTHFQPPPPPPNTELWEFQEGSGFDQFEFNRFLERMVSFDTNDGVLNQEHEYMFDEHGQLTDTNGGLKKFEAPNGEDKTV